jgi:outer membrane phospholipase A
MSDKSGDNPDISNDMGWGDLNVNYEKNGSVFFLLRLTI